MNPLKQLLSVFAGSGRSVDGGSEFPSVAPQWLAPISEAQPCGENLEYDAEYAVLRARLEPKADVQYGSFRVKPEAPDWPEVERDARKLFSRSKDISILVWFTRARCRMVGAAGLLEGLGVLAAVLEAYPEQVHPQLVLDGLDDPAVRANALAALCDPEGLLGDVRDVVVSGNTASRLSVRDVERAFSVPRPPYALDPEVVKRQLTDLYERGDANMHVLLHCGQCVLGIDQWSKTHLKEDAPDLRLLLRLLSSLASFSEAPERGIKTIADEVQHDAIPTSSWQAVHGNGEVVPRHGERGVVRGEARIAPVSLPTLTHNHVAQEREQIRELLRQVRAWIEHHEPSSPVAILIKQADRMWGKRFSEVATMIPPDLMQAWDRDD